MAGDMPAFMGQDGRDQVFRKCFQQSGGEHNKGIGIAVGICVGFHVQLQVQIRHRNPQLLADRRQHVIVLLHLVVPQLNPGGHVQDLLLGLVPEIHESLDQQGKARDGLQSLQGRSVGIMCIPFRIKRHLYSSFSIYII